MDDFDYEIAIGNLVMLHQPERWERLRRNMWWHLDLRGRAHALRDERQGRFMTRLDAERHAQAADGLILDGPLTR